VLKDFERYQPSTAPVLFVPLRGLERRLCGQPVTRAAYHRTMQAEQLFVQTLQEIADKLSDNPSDYELLKVAGLLRPVLIDRPSPLLDRAGAAANMDVEFRVVKPGPLPISPELDAAWAKYLAVHPNTNRINYAVHVRGNLLSGEATEPGDQVVDLTRADFLDHGIVVFQDEYYSVDSVLRLAANSLGGIHHDGGAPNWNPQAEKLRPHMEGAQMYGRSMLGWHVSLVADCTLRTCKPLVERLTQLGLYSPPSSEWKWSGGQVTTT
jgi:hypothetical protein